MLWLESRSRPKLFEPLHTGRHELPCLNSSSVGDAAGGVALAMLSCSARSKGYDTQLTKSRLVMCAFFENQVVSK